jgi:hypothetical protein
MGILLQEDVHGFSVGFLTNLQKRDKTLICDGFIAKPPKNISKTLESFVNQNFYTPDFRKNFVLKMRTKMILFAGKNRNRKFVKTVALHPCTSPDSREGRNHSAGTIPRPWERKK